MSALHWQLFFHLLGVVLLFAGLGAVTVGGMLTRQTTDPAGIVAAARIVRFGGTALVSVGALVALVFGFALIHTVHDKQSATFIWVSLILWVLLLALTHGVAVRHARKLITAGSGSNDDLLRLSASRTLAWAGPVLNLFALAIIALMVWQPGA